MSALTNDESLLLTWDEYIKFEEVYAGPRHELVRGRVHLMAGGSERHDLTVQAIYDQMRPALRDGPCRIFVHNRKVRTGPDTGYYPDLLVRCGRAADSLYEDDARVVVEVLSPSNDRADVTARLDGYQGLPSIEAILFVDHLRSLVTAYRRTPEGWREGQFAVGVQDLGDHLLVDWARVWADVAREATT